MPEVEIDYGDLLAPVERLAARLPEPFRTPEDRSLALEMLSDASEEARTHGSRHWTSKSVPPGVVNIVLKAASRGYMNPSGYVEEAADSARLRRGDDYVRGAEFTDSERQRTRALANFRGVTYSTSTRNDHWQSRSDVDSRSTVYVPVAGGHGNWRAFPWAEEGRL